LAALGILDAPERRIRPEEAAEYKAEYKKVMERIAQIVPEKPDYVVRA
jgi:hypothetical protein